MNSGSDPDLLPPLLLAAVRGASDLQATNVLALDVGDVLGITDWFVVTSASNVRQVRRIAEQIEEAVIRNEKALLPETLIPGAPRLPGWRQTDRRQSGRSDPPSGETDHNSVRAGYTASA